MVQRTHTTWEIAGQSGLDRIPGHATSPDPSRFRMRGSRWTLGGIDVAASIQSPYTATVPTAEDDAPHGPTGTTIADSMSVVFVRGGRWNLATSGSNVVFEPRSPGFADSHTPIVTENAANSTVVTVNFPRELVARHGVTVPVGIGSFTGGRLTAPSLSFVSGILNSLKDGMTDAEPAGTVISQLVAGMFVEREGYRMDAAALSRGLVARADALIRRHYAEQSLTPSILAGRLNVSVRHLQRAYASTGASPMESIRSHRLERAVDELIAGRRTVGEIAFRTGFSDASALRRALKATHGMAPRDFRHTLASRA
jgi:AraC-like DNA-binding protein